MGTSEISSMLQSRVPELYADLFAIRPFLLVSLVLFALGTWYAAVVLSRRAGAPEGSRAKTPVAGALVFLALGLGVVFSLFNRDDFGGLFPALAVCAFGVVAITALALGLPWRKWPAAAFAFLFFALPYLVKLPTIRQGYSELSSYEPVSQLGLFAASSYIQYRAVISVLVGIVLAAVALVLLGERCVPAKDDSPKSIPGQESLADVVKDSVGDALKGGLRTLAVALVAALLLAPSFLVPSVGARLVSGTAATSNAYVAMLDEYLSDSEVAADETWLNAFAESSNTIYCDNARFLGVAPDSVDKADIATYILYSEASFRQMRSIEEILSHVQSRQDMAALIGQFNQSIDDQQSALYPYAAYADGPMGTLQQAGDVFYDGVFFYLQRLGFTGACIVFAIVGVLLAVLAFVLRRRSAVGHASGQGDVATIVEGPKATPASDAPITVKSLALALVSILVIAAFGVVQVVSAVQDSAERENAASFTQAVVEVASVRPLELVQWLNEAESHGSSSSSIPDLQEGLQLIDAQIAELETLAAWEEVPEGAENLVAAQRQLGQKELPLLQKMRETLASGELPPKELVSQYRALHYGQDASELVGEMQRYLLSDSVSNLADTLGG